MTRTNLHRLTVPQLRQLCGERGLPKYQSAGIRLRKADLINQLDNSMKSSTYRVLPAYEKIKVGNGARKWRTTLNGIKVLSAAYQEYEILKMIDDSIRYADPANPSKTYKTKIAARKAVQQRLIDESNRIDRKIEETKSRSRRRWMTQQEIDGRFRTGGFVASVN